MKLWRRLYQLSRRNIFTKHLHRKATVLRHTTTALIQIAQRRSTANNHGNFSGHLKESSAYATGSFLAGSARAIASDESFAELHRSRCLRNCSSARPDVCYRSCSQTDNNRRWEPQVPLIFASSACSANMEGQKRAPPRKKNAFGLKWDGRRENILRG